jgi:Family of unknown function (DUF6516)
MQAKLIYRNKMYLASGAIVEEMVWKLPQADEERPHGLKYSLVYIRDGRRVVGYDNERGKGDHRHYGSHEEPYNFVSIDQLIADFKADVEREESKR